ncbi:MAG: hypothetical protein ABJA16_08290 [Nakamurella sp.]
MSIPTDGCWRSVRTSAFVLVAAQIAVTGHVIGGGRPTDLSLLVGMSALLIVSLRPLAVRRYRFPTLLAAMAGTQLAFHLVLTVAAAGHSGMEHIHPIRMLTFHAVAAVVSAALLAHGDRLLCALHGWLTRRLPRLVPVPAIPGEISWTAVIDRAGHVLRSRVAESSVKRRGPPTECVPSR